MKGCIIASIAHQQEKNCAVLRDCSTTAFRALDLLTQGVEPSKCNNQDKWGGGNQAGAFTKQFWGLKEQARHNGGLPGLLVAFILEQGEPRAGGKGLLVQPAGAKGLDLP